MSEDVYVPRRISRALAARLLREHPDLKRIFVPRSLYEQTSRKVIAALRAVGVEVLPTGRGRGRPRKYGEDVVNRVIEMRRKGASVREISERTGIPLRTVYYLLRHGYKGGSL